MISYKLLLEGKTRLKTRVEISDGFKIAEVAKNTKNLVNAINTAIPVLQEDSNLSKPENANIKKTYLKVFKNSKIWSEISY